MSTYRIYVDSRERVDGTDTDFTFELPYTLAIKEKSLAMIDVVCVPNSILTVTENKNDTIWLKETRSFEETFYRFAKNSPGVLHSPNTAASNPRCFEHRQTFVCGIQSRI